MLPQIRGGYGIKVFCFLHQILVNIFIVQKILIPNFNDGFKIFASKQQININDSNDNKLNHVYVELRKPKVKHSLCTCF